MEDERGDFKKIQVLTLNCWGIPYVSKHVKKRFSYIAKELATGKYDIVSLQEVWSQSDYDYICKKVAEVLPYTVYFHSGVNGSGVCVFSKYPITDTFTYRFTLNGYIYMVHHGDWFGGKSAGYCMIDHPKQPIHLFTTHCGYNNRCHLDNENQSRIRVKTMHFNLHAEYNRQNDTYLAHRTVQAFQLSEFIIHLTKPSDCVIVCGDMNTEPTDVCYRVIKHLPGLTDTWDIAERQNGFHGNTCDVSTNSYTSVDLGKQLKGGATDGKRIDYIFYRATLGGIKCVGHAVTMGQIPGEDLSYSDHEGVLATFVVEDPSSVKSQADQKESLKKTQQDVLREVMNIAQDGMDSISKGNLMALLLVGILAVFILFPLAYSPSYSSVFHILRPLGKILYLMRFLCGMFLTGLLFHVIFITRDEWNTYQNVQQEVKLQMKYQKK